MSPQTRSRRSDIVCRGICKCHGDTVIGICHPAGPTVVKILVGNEAHFVSKSSLTEWRPPTQLKPLNRRAFARYLHRRSGNRTPATFLKDWIENQYGVIPKIGGSKTQIGSDSVENPLWVQDVLNNPEVTSARALAQKVSSGRYIKS